MKRPEALFRRPLFLVHAVAPGALPLDETVDEMAERVGRVVREALETCHGQAAAIVSHADPIKAFWNKHLGRAAWRFHFLELPKGGFIELEYEGDELAKITPHGPILGATAPGGRRPVLTGAQLAIVAAVFVVVALVVVVLLLRRRRPGLQIAALPRAEAERYRHDFDAIQAQAGNRATQSAARARGLVEEVLRRMGFPDRVDSAQKARDVAGYDRAVARLLTDADAEIRAAGTDRARLTRVVNLYRQALDGLLGVEELSDG